jgi:hypothetical protein
MLILNSYRGRIFLYAGTRDFSQTGWFPSGWGLDSTSAAHLVPQRNKSRLSWSYGSDQYGRRILFPHWFLVLVVAPLTAIAWARWKRRFSLRTLLIAATLVAVGMGVIVMSS